MNAIKRPHGAARVYAYLALPVFMLAAILPAPLWAQSPSASAFNTEQSISDEAQRKTLAFAGLAMMTGNLEAQSFFPPGKVADYTGFQYLRDNDPDEMGHNTSFLTRVANNMIFILDDSQFDKLQSLASAQLTQIDLYGYKRYPLMKAFRRLMEGGLPAGASGLSLAAVQQASRDLYLIDGQISFDRALLYANIIGSLSSKQLEYIDAMKGKGWKSWPDVPDDAIRERMKSLPRGTAVAVMTYASDLFSWYTGSVEADVYFCPERHGTYFGSFYIKDAPAVGHEGYSISTQLTATAGEALSESSQGYVTSAQAALMTSLVDKQRDNLYAGTTNIVQIRTKIATLLRGLIVSTTNSAAVKSEVLALSATYGELDGENNYHYAAVFAEIYKSLSEAQKTKLAQLRKSIMSGTYDDGTPFDYSTCTTPFLYSSPINDTAVLEPYVSSTDSFFGAAGTTQNPSPQAQNRTIGLITHDPAKAAPGYTLMAPKHYTRTYLLDNYGRVIRTWDSKYEPGQSAHLLPNGNLLRAAMIKVPGGGTGGGEGGRIEEYDWNGNLVWEFDHATVNYSLHHDIKPLPNGNVIALMVERKTREEAIAAGVKPDLMADSYLLPDAVVEIEPIRPKGGRIVWEWHVWDHLVQNVDPSKQNYGVPSGHPELVDPNAGNRRIPAFWNHMNSIDYNPALDQIILSVRGNSEAWVIDHSTTKEEAASHSGGRYGKGGDLLYRWGNPRMYSTGATADQMLFEQHDVQWIEEGRPGAGNLLAFNNGLSRPGGGGSSADEWVPPVDSKGFYSRADGSPFGPKTLAWTFMESYGTKYFEEAISGAYRLINGNTLICYGTNGVLVEVTPDKQVVWEYVNPVVNEGVLKQGEVSGKDDRGHNWNAVFKVRRYAPDYPGIVDKDLTPIGPLVEGDEPDIVEPDPGSTSILPADLYVEEIAWGLEFAEGPVWSETGRLLFSDVKGNKICEWTSEDGAQVHLDPSGNANGLALDLFGQLVVAQQGERQVVRLSADGTQSTLASHYEGKRLNSPNDIAVKSDGTIYFTDPTYGIQPSQQELPHSGVYRVTSGPGSPQLLEAKLARPNGLAFSPDESVLYVADSASRKIFAYPVLPGGTLAEGAELLTIPDGGEPDGIEVDIKGNLYVAGGDDRVWIFSSQGAWIDTLPVPQRSRNLAWGDKDRKTLFIAAGTSIYRSRMDIGGVTPPRLVSLTGGEYQMGDHQGLGGLEHGNDEIPIHSVQVGAIHAGATEVTAREYANFLNASLGSGEIEVRDGTVYAAGGATVLTETNQSAQHSPFGWDGSRFTVLNNRSAHPATGIRWHGAAMYANWLSERNGWETCYDTETWAVDYTKKCFRLPTEAEWEYAARGGQYAPYLTYPTGDTVDYLKANLPGSGDPYESGDYPWTTPAGFFNGVERRKTDFAWPAAAESFSTSDSANGFRLYDVAGNVWEWCNDWYGRDYYAVSPKDNPTGPAEGSPMPDGQPYRVLRGGSWYNGPDGHSRVSNRNPSYYRGPDDPSHAWYHIGFRIFASTGIAKP